ncbi:MAG: acetolactate synthase [Pelagibacterales bacterium]|nr:acetolactate synthase [Pelagibacterales bacterium]
MKFKKYTKKLGKKYKTKSVSEILLDFLTEKKVDKVFVLTGGAIAFAVDSFSNRKDISYICVQHEQAGAMMADAYSRVKNNFAATMSTSGPGATNLITGIACSYFDSIPNIHITGQVNLKEQRGGMPGTSNSRQIGFQETDIVSISKPITKKSIQLKKAEDIYKVLNDLYNCSQSGRRGPVLLDLPMCLQRKGVVQSKKIINKPKHQKIKLSDINKIYKIIKYSERPVILSGGGVRYSNSVKELNKLIKYLKIPVVSSWSGTDTISSNNKLYYGHVGVYGSRAANFIIQNSDCILSLGSRLDTRITGGKPETFARKAKLIMVDIDKGELSKRRGLKPYLEVHEDCKSFINRFSNKVRNENFSFSHDKNWIKYCNSLKKKYPTVSKLFNEDKNFINPYLFVEELSKQLKRNDIIIPDDGGHLTWFMQAFKTKLGQRVFSAFGNSPMGYSFPAAIGASIAKNKQRVICIDGDGSFQINMQELQTVVNEKLPIKIFIFNNGGYGIIKQFQSLYLGKRYNASGIGVSAPNYKKIAKAYNIKYLSVKKDKDSRNIIKQSLVSKKAVIIEVFIHPNQKIMPKLAFGCPIEDLEPRLDRKEFLKQMIIKPIISDSNVIEAN